MESRQPLIVPRWYVVQAKPRQDQRAESNLRQWGVETLAPKIRRLVPGCGVGKGAYGLGPLFPGYLFARFDASALLAKVRLTRGVHGVVGFGEGATPIDDTLVDQLRMRLENDEVVRVDEPRPGDKVQIVSGPFRSLVGVFERELNGRGRVVILLDVLASQTRVDVPKDSMWKTTCV